MGSDKPGIPNGPKQPKRDKRTYTYNRAVNLKPVLVLLLFLSKVNKHYFYSAK
jgi:hypothetical protein